MVERKGEEEKCSTRFLFVSVPASLVRRSARRLHFVCLLRTSPSTRPSPLARTSSASGFLQRHSFSPLTSSLPPPSPSWHSSPLLSAQRLRTMSALRIETDWSTCALGFSSPFLPPLAELTLPDSFRHCDASQGSSTVSRRPRASWFCRTSLLPSFPRFSHLLPSFPSSTTPHTQPSRSLPGHSSTHTVSGPPPPPLPLPSPALLLLFLLPPLPSGPSSIPSRPLPPSPPRRRQ